MSPSQREFHQVKLLIRFVNYSCVVRLLNGILAPAFLALAKAIATFILRFLSPETFALVTVEGSLENTSRNAFLIFVLCFEE